jgi:hypothetical protein
LRLLSALTSRRRILLVVVAAAARGKPCELLL